MSEGLVFEAVVINVIRWGVGKWHQGAPEEKQLLEGEDTLGSRL